MEMYILAECLTHRSRLCSVGVGFSYSEFGQDIGTTEEAAKDVDAFVTLFFETFSQFKGRAFHMSGE